MSLSQDQYSDQYKHELKINEYEKEIKWQNDLDRDTELSAAHKLVLRQLRQIIKRVRYDLDEPVRIYISELVSRTGMEDSSVRRKLAQLADYGLITKIIKRIRVGNEIRNELWVSLAQHIRNDAKSIAAPNRNHGGKRTCEKCGSQNIDVYIAYECRDCGHIHHADVEHMS
jgi:DNA-binding transcriptional ArsR family regulator